MGKVTTSWRDASYSRGERGTKLPTVWELDLDGMRISIHRLHGIEGEWFGSCHTMGIERHQLEASYLPLARMEFLDYLKGRCERWIFKIKDARTEVDHGE